MICEMCGNMATDFHHLLSQTKRMKKLYGKLIHDERNIMYLCNGCHLSKSVPKYSELVFCEKLGIKPRSKELMQKIEDGKIKKFWKD